MVPSGNLNGQAVQIACYDKYAMYWKAGCMCNVYLDHDIYGVDSKTINVDMIVDYIAIQCFFEYKT